MVELREVGRKRQWRLARVVRARASRRRWRSFEAFEGLDTLACILSELCAGRKLSSKGQLFAIEWPQEAGELLCISCTRHVHCPNYFDSVPKAHVKNVPCPPSYCSAPHFLAVKLLCFSLVIPGEIDVVELHTLAQTLVRTLTRKACWRMLCLCLSVGACPSLAQTPFSRILPSRCFSWTDYTSCQATGFQVHVLQFSLRNFCHTHTFTRGELARAMDSITESWPSGTLPHHVLPSSFSSKSRTSVYVRRP